MTIAAVALAILTMTITGIISLRERRLEQEACPACRGATGALVGPPEGTPCARATTGRSTAAGCNRPRGRKRRVDMQFK